jgi:Co/Zn/Cd efflux system component
MSAGCYGHIVNFIGPSATCKRVLWAVIAINETMFWFELSAGLLAGSQALKADAYAIPTT